MTEFRYELAKFITFRDFDECRRVAAIPKSEICNHPNPDFRIRVIEEPEDFYLAFAMDLVGRIVRAREEDRQFVAILPVGPVPQYKIAAKTMNTLRIPMDHVHIFNMDEYANEDGITAPYSWDGSFQRAMDQNLYGLIDPKLAPPEKQRHFPTHKNVNDYGKMIEDLGGADVCYGGIGWCGHIAFWESHLGLDFVDNLDEYLQQGSRIVELHPMTVMQNALHSFSGDWSKVPPKAATIGPAEIVGAKARSFWLDGYLGGGVSWQRFIARLVAHGPVTPLVPGSILQTVPTDFTILGGVADDVVVDMA